MNATATKTRKTTTTKPETLRMVRITPRPTITNQPVFTLTMTFTTILRDGTEKVETTQYILTKYVDGFSMDNQTNGKSYLVRLVLKGNQARCNCLGQKHHNHCKHHEALVALNNAGKLPGNTTTPACKPQTTTQPTYADFDNP